MWSHPHVKGGLDLGQHALIRAGEVREFLSKKGLYVEEDGAGTPGGTGIAPAAKKRSRKKAPGASTPGKMSAQLTTPVSSKAAPKSRKRKAVAASPGSTPAAKRSASTVPRGKSKSPKVVAMPKSADSGKKKAGKTAARAGAGSGKKATKTAKGAGKKDSDTPTERELRLRRRNEEEVKEPEDEVPEAPKRKAKPPGQVLKALEKAARSEAGDDYASAGSTDVEDL